MSRKTINLRDFSKELYSLASQDLELAKEAIARGVVNSMHEIIKSSPVDTGLYAQSFRVEETSDSVEFGNFAPHAQIIEHGARPFTPPIGPLLGWAKRVLQDASQPPEYSDEVQALAYAAQAKIQKEGFEPKHIMENSIELILTNIEKEINSL